MAETALGSDNFASLEEEEVVQNIYDEIEIDDMDFEDDRFYYPCPCGDKFQITLVSYDPDSPLDPFRSKSCLRRETSQHALVAHSRSRSFLMRTTSRTSLRTTA